MLIRRKIGELRVSELRAELEKRSLDSKGLKGALLQRLQKAIIEEGGDVNQIEVEAAASPNPKLKNSPRIKKSVETSAQSATDTNKAFGTVPIVPAAVPSEPAAVKPSTSDNEAPADDLQITGLAKIEKPSPDDEPTTTTEKLEDSSMHEGTVKEEFFSNPNQGPQGEEVAGQGEAGALEDEDSALQATKAEDHYSEEQEDNYLALPDDYGNEHTMNEESEILADEQDLSRHDDDDGEDEFVELVDEADDDQNENFEDETHRPIESSNIEPISGDEEMAELKQTDENEPDFAESTYATSADYAENADDGEEEPDEENSSDIAIEDDVLDMLDYDIEIPEQASQEDGSKEGDTNEDEAEEGDVKAKVSGTSSDTNIKDPSDKTESTSESERNKDVAEVDDVKLSKNLWISGLSASTRASELKVAFSRYGKVVGAKVVTSARSPGTKCYGFVAMATLSAADKCILHLNKTELHGRVIAVEHTKNDPSARKAPRSGRDDKDLSADSKDLSSHPAALRSRRSTSDAKGSKLHSERPGESSRSSFGSGGRLAEKRPRSPPLMERPRGSARTLSTRGDGSGERIEPFRKRPRPLDNRERKVMIDKRGGLSLRVNVRSAQDERKPHVLSRVTRSPTQLTSRRFESRRPVRGRGRPLARPRDARDDIRGRKAAGESSRRALPMALTASIERDRMLLQKEREERNFLRDQREQLERERRQLERDRMERERLEHERIRLEQERKRELEKIEREKREMKRLQEINRYEQSQRQRALKRMHDDRAEKRVDRDDRRRYDPDSRDRGSSSTDMYREEGASFRPRSSGQGSRSDKSNYHDVDRRNMSHDTDARYSHSSSAGGRRVEKYDRSGMKPGGDYSHERRGNESSRGSLSYRHQDKDSSDDRKVVSRDRGRPSSSALKEVGRGGSPSMSWKEGKSSSGGGSRSRATDRDLREEIRQGSSHGGGSSRKATERGDHRHREDASPSRRSSSLARSDSMPYERGQSDSNPHRSIPMPSPSGGNPIPTTGRNGMNSFPPSTTWPAWQERPEPGNMWHGPRGPGGPMVGGAPVGRMMTPMGVPFNSMNPMNPPMRMSGGMMAHGISPNYVPPDQRVDNFKQMRRY